MNRLYENYHDRVAFYVVYIQEAHPIDAWQDEDNQKDHIALASPKNLDERCNIAGTCLTKLSLKLPAIVDDITNSAETAYTGWPDRLYVIDREGRIAYKSRPGPFGFHPDQVGKTLEKIFPAPTQRASTQ